MAEIQTLITDRFIVAGILAVVGGAIAFGPELVQSITRMRSQGVSDAEPARATVRAEMA